MTVRYHHRRGSHVPDLRLPARRHRKRPTRSASHPRRRHRRRRRRSCCSTPSPRWPSRPRSPSPPNSSTAPTDADQLRAAHVATRPAPRRPGPPPLPRRRPRQPARRRHPRSRLEHRPARTRRRPRRPTTQATTPPPRPLTDDPEATASAPWSPTSRHLERPRHPAAGTQTDDPPAAHRRHRARTGDTITVARPAPGGQDHTLTLPTARTSLATTQTPPHVVAAVDDLLDHHTHAEIADILNNRGLTSGKGRPSTDSSSPASSATTSYPAANNACATPACSPSTEMAAALGVSTGTIKTWRDAGLVTGHRYNDHGQMLYHPPDPNPPTRHQGHPALTRRRPAQTPQPTTTNQRGAV